jgi:ribonuclease D
MYSYITSSKVLIDLVGDMLQQPPYFMSVDTEFVRTHTYFPKLGVIQLGFEDTVWVIDALSCSMEILKPLLYNQNIIKIFHSCRQDLEILFALFHEVPTPFFDLQIAAGLLGYGPQPSLEHLSFEFNGVHLDKTNQFSHWCDRPLTENMLIYAYQDARIIYDLYSVMIGKLTEQGRHLWHEHIHLNIKKTVENPLNIDRIYAKLKQVFLNKKKQQQLFELAIWREKKAMQHNKPREHFLNHKIMEKLVLNLPLSKDHFKSILFLEKPICFSALKKEIRHELYVFLERLNVSSTDLIEIEESIKGTSQKQIKLKEYVQKQAEILKIEAHYLLDKDGIKNFCRDENFKENLPFWKKEILKDFIF